MKKIKIAYISVNDPQNIHSWSGSTYFLAKAMKEQGFEIIYIGPLKIKNKLINKLIKAFKVYVLKKNYHIDRNQTVVDYFAEQAEQQLKQLEVDIIFSPGTLAISSLNTNIPIITWADATFDSLCGYYLDYLNMDLANYNSGQKIEKTAFDKIKYTIFTSQWAVDSAIKKYNLNPEKVKLIPFGANINIHPKFEDIKEKIEIKLQNDTLELIFVGVRWQEKGADIAVEVVRQLNKKGIKTILHLVGIEAPYPTEDFIIKHGFISKSSIEGQEKLNNLYNQSHFLIVPSRAECYGLVFAEASSFGVPSISSNTGGIPSVIKNDINGKLFELDASIEEYTNYISRIWQNKDIYKKLALNSFDEFDSRLNWEFAGKEFKKIVESVLNSK